MGLHHLFLCACVVYFLVFWLFCFVFFPKSYIWVSESMNFLDETKWIAK